MLEGYDQWANLTRSKALTMSQVGLLMMEHCNRLAGRLLVDTRQSLAKPGGRCRCWADTPLIHALPAPLHFVLFLEPAASMTACSLILEGECKRMQKVLAQPFHFSVGVASAMTRFGTIHSEFLVPLFARSGPACSLGYLPPQLSPSVKRAAWKHAKTSKSQHKGHAISCFYILLLASFGGFPQGG